MKRFTIAIFLSFIFSLSSFANEWFVCLGSFKIKDNATRFCDVLKNKGFYAELDECAVQGETYYRVLLMLGFEDIENARLKKNELYLDSNLMALKLKDLWVCIPSQEFYGFYKSRKIDNNSENVLKKNENILSSSFQNEPYSVLVAKYKEEDMAYNTDKRLKEKNIDSYVLKTYDDDDYFSFNVHAGKFKDKEDAEKEAERLKSLGIRPEKVTSYEEIKDSIARYDEVVSKEMISKDDGNWEIPSSFSKHVSACIKEFPIHKDFQLETLNIFDLDNIRQFGEENIDTGEIKYSLENKESTHAVSLCEYRDTLFDKKVKILFASGDEGAYHIENDEEGTEREFKIVDDVIKCFIVNNESGSYLKGINNKRSVFIEMTLPEFSQIETTLFLDNISNDSNLLTYPGVRKNLLILPKENEGIQRQFLHFNLEKVSPSYAKEKGYASWAIPIVGHWASKGFFDIEGNKVSVTFFDLDYDYNAKRIHDLFMKNHEEAPINDYNKPISLKRKQGWLLDKFFSGTEISFSVKSYIVAINSYDINTATKELVNLGDELQIWQ